MTFDEFMDYCEFLKGYYGWRDVEGALRAIEDSPRTNPWPLDAEYASQKIRSKQVPPCK